MTVGPALNAIDNQLVDLSSVMGFRESSFLELKPLAFDFFAKETRRGGGGGGGGVGGGGGKEKRE